MDAVLNNLPLTCTLVGVAGIVFAILLAAVVKGAPAGNEKMQEIAGAIQEGAIAYLNRQMKSMGIAGIIIFGVIFATMGAKTAIGFLMGAVASFLAGYIGMRVSVLANVRTAEAAKKGMAAGLSMAFKGGSVTGMIVAGLALTGLVPLAQACAAGPGSAPVRSWCPRTPGALRLWCAPSSAAVSPASFSTPR